MIVWTSSVGWINKPNGLYVAPQATVWYYKA